MSYNGWKDVKLGDICTLNYGKALTAKSRIQGKIPVYSSAGITGWHNHPLVDGEGIIIGRKGSVGTVYYSESPFFCIDTAYYVLPCKDYHLKYLFYRLKSLGLENMNEDSAVPGLNRDTAYSQRFLLPPYKEQPLIADTLSSLDDKIELNQKIDKKLEEIAQAIFKSWFVSFDPYQDGELEDSEFGRIPKGWIIGVLNDIIEIFDSKRIPLSSRKRQAMKKNYPYYGATSLMDYVEDYIFDGSYVLLGEDGTVVDNMGYPILQYVWGKFWVNNHAHILKGKNGFNEDSIFMMLKNTNVQSIVTGAVQLKINQANLKSVKVVIPSNEDILKFNNLIEPIFAEKRRVFEETQILINLRNSILPKLMNGEIRIPIEEVQ